MQLEPSPPALDNASNVACHACIPFEIRASEAELLLGYSRSLYYESRQRSAFYPLPPRHYVGRLRSLSCTGKDRIKDLIPIHRICSLLRVCQAYDSQGKALQDETPVSGDESPFEASSWDKPKDTAVESRWSCITTRTRCSSALFGDSWQRPLSAPSMENIDEEHHW